MDSTQANANEMKSTFRTNLCSSTSLSTAAGLLSLSLLGGCVVSGSARSAPPPYTGADTVSEASLDQLVGGWAPTMLNPRADIKDWDLDSHVQIEADGSVVSETHYDNTDSPMDGATLTTRGTWSVEGDTVTMTITDVTSDNDNPFMNFVTGLGSSVARNRVGTSTANIYELSSNHFILVQDSGEATRYDRIEK